MAMEEIKSILKKYDIAATVCLHTIEGPANHSGIDTHVHGYAEYLMHISPSYSAAHINGDRFQVLGKQAHYKSREERDTKLASTVNMIETLSIETGRLSMQLFDMDEEMKKMVQVIKNGPDEDTSHVQQNN
jgi:hypothetical protein